VGVSRTVAPLHCTTPLFHAPTRWQNATRRQTGRSGWVSIERGADAWRVQDAVVARAANEMIGVDVITLDQPETTHVVAATSNDRGARARPVSRASSSAQPSLHHHQQPAIYSRTLLLRPSLHAPAFPTWRDQVLAIISTGWHFPQNIHFRWRNTDANRFLSGGYNRLLLTINFNSHNQS